MRLRNMLTRWTRTLRRRWLVLRLSRIDAQRRRIEALPVAADRSAALSRARSLEALCVERARVRYFISGGGKDPAVPSASSTDRKQERAVATNCSSGHSPRLRSSLPNVTHR